MVQNAMFSTRIEYNEINPLKAKKPHQTMVTLRAYLTPASGNSPSSLNRAICSTMDGGWINEYPNSARNKALR